MSDDLAPQQSEATPSIDHADASILENWNTIRAADEGGDEVQARTDGAVRTRDAAGKFAAAAAVTEPADATVVDPVAPALAEPTDPAEPVVQAKESPKAWRKEIADKHWAALAPDLQDAILEREQAVASGIERYRAGAEAAQRFEQAYRPYEATLRQVGATPEQAVEAFFKADHTLRYGSPAQKAAQLAQLAQNYGVALDQVQSHITNPQPVDPLIQGLQEKVEALTAQQQQRESEQAQKQLDQLTSEVTTFAKGKEHFEAVQDEIMMVLPGINQRFPELGPQEKLQRAYDIAVNANPTVRAAIAAQQQAKATAEAQKKATEARKSASVNVPQRGVIPAAGPALSMDETIRAKAVELGLA